MYFTRYVLCKCLFCAVLSPHRSHCYKWSITSILWVWAVLYSTFMYIIFHVLCWAVCLCYVVNVSFQPFHRTPAYLIYSFFFFNLIHRFYSPCSAVPNWLCLIQWLPLAVTLARQRFSRKCSKSVCTDDSWILQGWRVTGYQEFTLGLMDLVRDREMILVCVRFRWIMHLVL